MAKIFNIPFYKGTFLDQHDSTITKSGTNNFNQRGKGYSLRCNNSNYIYSGVVVGNFNTIVIEVYLDTDIVAGVTLNKAGSFRSGSSWFSFGTINIYTPNSTFNILSAVGEATFIKDNISAGYNQIILNWNGSSYDVWLNGVKCTTFNYTIGVHSTRFFDSNIYFGKVQSYSYYFTGDFLNCEIYDHSFSTIEITRKYNEFVMRSPINPTIRGFNTFVDGVIKNYPPAQNATYVKATTYYDAFFYPHFATDPTKPLTGTYTNNTWFSQTCGGINQRFHIDLGEGKIINKIYYENLHHNGTFTNYGVKNFTFWGSNTASDFADLVYANDGTWVQLTTDVSEFDIHIASNVADPKYIIVTNNVAYRYYAFKFANHWGAEAYMAVRRIELRVDKVVHTIGAPYLYETFARCPADGKTIQVPQDWIAGTGTWSIREDVNGKYMKCVTAGTIKIRITCDSSKTMTITYNDTVYEDTIANLHTAYAWLTYSTNYITITSSINDTIRNIVIKD